MSRVRIARIAREINHHANMDEQMLYNRCQDQMEKLHLAYLLRKSNIVINSINIFSSYLVAFDYLFDPNKRHEKKNSLTILRVYKPEEFKDYISTKFNHVSSEMKNYITSVKVIKNLFQGQTIYYDNEFNNTTVVCSSYFLRDLTHNPKNLILLLTIIGEDKIDSKFLELYKDPTTSTQDWLEYYEDGFNIDRIKSLEEIMERNKLGIFERRMDELNRRYEDLMSRLKDNRMEANIVAREFANTESMISEKSRLIKDINDIPQIEDISLSPDGTGLSFVVLTNLEVDENFVKPQMISNPLFRGFCNNILMGNIEVKIGHKITLRLTGGGVNDVLVDSANISDVFKEFTIYRNPHLSHYNCFGDFKHQIYQAFDKGQYYQTALLIIRSVSQLNLADSTVVNHFRSHYFRDGLINVYIPEYNQSMNYLSYLERKKNEQDLASSQV